MAKNIVSLLLVAMALFGNLAFAAPAIHIDDQGCGLRDGNGNFVVTTKEHAVITDSGMIELIGDHSTDGTILQTDGISNS